MKRTIDEQLRYLIERDAFEAIVVSIDSRTDEEIREVVNNIDEVKGAVDRISDQWAERSKGFWLNAMNSVNVGFCWVLNDDEAWWIDLPACFIFDFMGWPELETKFVEDPNKKEVI